MKKLGNHRAVLGLGSNLGKRTVMLEKAIQGLEAAGINVLEISSIYESAPWGYKSEHNFLNQCIEIECALSPLSLLDLCKNIEMSLGRKTGADGYSDRPIDMDILFYDDLHIETRDLIIPHPAISERKFVLIPLLEICPAKPHPVSGKTISELLDECTDKGRVIRLADK